MESDTAYNIAELASAAGITARAVRFYVQQGLIEPPRGAGRGSHYTASHLRALREIQTLQRMGHALAAIKAMTGDERQERATGAASVSRPDTSPPLVTNTPDGADPPRLPTRLVTRVELAPGVVLEFDHTRHMPAMEQLRRIADMTREVFR